MVRDRERLRALFFIKNKLYKNIEAQNRPFRWSNLGILAFEKQTSAT